MRVRSQWFNRMIFAAFVLARLFRSRPIARSKFLNDSGKLSASVGPSLTGQTTADHHFPATQVLPLSPFSARFIGMPATNSITSLWQSLYPVSTCTVKTKCLIFVWCINPVDPDLYKVSIITQTLLTELSMGNECLLWGDIHLRLYIPCCWKVSLSTMAGKSDTGRGCIFSEILNIYITTLEWNIMIYWQNCLNEYGMKRIIWQHCIA